MVKSIDAVISWVDGNDPVFQKKLNDFCIEKGLVQTAVIEPTRIQQCNEILYCLKSIERFAPWIRTVFIITNEQTPEAVQQLKGTEFGNKIKIINQNDLLRKFNQTEPVFNSLSIEWLMWNIEGLSEHFIYFNDDIFLIRDVSPQDFFNTDGILIHGKWKIKRRNLKDNPHRAWQQQSAQLAGMMRYFFFLDHAPVPLMRSTFEAYIKDFPAMQLRNIAYAFRHPEQVSSIPLMVHLDIRAKRAMHEKSLKSIMVNGAAHPFSKIKSRLTKAQKDSKITFLCMQSIDQAPQSIKQYMINWLSKHIPKDIVI